jgi:hypothetical protein
MYQILYQSSRECTEKRVQKEHKNIVTQPGVANFWLATLATQKVAKKNWQQQLATAHINVFRLGG